MMKYFLFLSMITLNRGLFESVFLKNFQAFENFLVIFPCIPIYWASHKTSNRYVNGMKTSHSDGERGCGKKDV